jgi:protein-S-isoprenylcysteine O-methyltransferase Ste14
MVNLSAMEKSFVAIFVIIAGFAICLDTIFNMPSAALSLLLVNFIIAGFVAIFGSLRLRQEEEEKRVK